MRLDHLLSKDWLCGVASWSCVVWIVEWVWAGWGSALAEGLGGRPCLVGLFSRVVGLSGAGMRDTPAAAWLVVVGAPACFGVGLIVDFRFLFFLIGCKLLRAHGGCLGIKSR